MLPDSNHALVYVHIGPKFPSYLSIAIAQARLFNPKTPIYLIANKNALSRYNCAKQEVISIPIESLKMTKHHSRFQKHIKIDGFWRYAIERFFYIDDFIQEYNLNNVFHTENDVMIYFDIEDKLPIFYQNYNNMIATVFDCDERSVPSLVYISNPYVSEKLAKFMSYHGCDGKTDMTLLNDFKEHHYKRLMDHLPILISEYANDRPLISLSKKRAQEVSPYINFLDQFGMIFDAAALGQFLGGIDPILNNRGAGFVAELSVFLTPYFEFKWAKDSKERWIPYISYKGTTYPIANLHIHCKDLRSFFSLNKNHFPLPTRIWSSLPLEESCPHLSR